MVAKDRDTTATPASIPEEHDGDAPAPESAVEHDEHEHDAAIAVPDSGDSGEGGKLKMIVQLLKKCLGVKDLAAMRLSLPASLLEPIPNLEYWQYLDRPDLFAAINDSDDPFERMLAVIRFTFTKDLKFIRGKVVKPYNSVLGEHFRAHWDVLPVDYPSDHPLQPPIHREHTTSPAPSANASKIFGKGPKDESVLSFRSGKSGKSATKRASSLFEFAAARVTPLPKSNAASPRVGATTSNGSDGGSGSGSASGGASVVESNLAAQVSNLSLGRTSGSVSGGESGDGDCESEQRIRIAFLTEQVSHHPPISAYHASCPARGLSLSGIDQISARVSGTSVRVAPGSYNKGIFLAIEDGPGKGERYHVTHPMAMVNGMLRGSFYVTVGESTVVTCESLYEDDGEGEGKGKERLRAIIEYKDESWISAPKFAIEGIIHTYREGDTSHLEWTKVKHVPRSCAVAFFDGSWRTRVRWRRASSAAPSSSSPSSGPSSNSNSNSASSTSTPTPTPTADEPGTLIDLSTLLVVPKRVRPLEKQHKYESRRLWENVTSRLVAKEYGEATRHKHAIEQRQREKAAERKKKGEEFIPVYFEKDIESGIPRLTAEGRKALEDELRTTEAGP